MATPQGLESHYRALVEAAMDAIITIDSAQRIVQFNAAAESMFQWPATDVIGQPLGILLPERYRRAHASAVDGFARSGLTRRQMGALGELVALRADGQEFPIEASISAVGPAPAPFCAVILRDLTARRALERRTERQADLFAAISRSNSALVRMRDPQVLFQEICRICVEHGHVTVAYVALVDGDHVTPVAWAGPGEPLVTGIEISLDPARPTGIGPVARCIRDGVPYVANDVYADPNTLPWRDRIARIGARATAAFPIFRGGVAVGALTLHVAETGFYTPELVSLFRELVGDISFALDNLDRDAARVAAVAAAQAGLERFQAIFHTTPIATSIATLDEGRFLDVNQAFCELLGYARDDIIGRTVADLGLRAEGLDRAMYLQRLARDRRLRNEQLTIRLRSGDMRDALVSTELIEFQDRTCTLSTYEDVTERNRYEARIEYLATHDALTGLPNRTLARDRIEQGMRQARRDGTSVGVLFLDLDRFKVINDSLGHRAGDEALGLVAQRLREVTRHADTVARVGGDEFVVVLLELHGPGDAALVAQKVAEAFQRPLWVAGQQVYVSTSIGIALFPQHGGDVDTLVRNADVAMYFGKRAGHGAFQLYSADMEGTRPRQVEFETDLRLALPRAQLHLAYQPKIDLASGHVSGVEALLRWSHPEQGEVPPARFIPIAEESGLIVPIGEWVLETACRQAKAWQDAGLRAVPVAVNLSPRQFLQRNLVETVRATLARAALAPTFLELELTESLIAQDLETVTRTIQELGASGVRFAIDDFGVGYSSLSHLKRFRVDRLKIDQSFVRHLESNSGDAGIALAIISMARSLDLQVTAEGVETEGQCAFLRKHRCDEAQGYLFSRPVSASVVGEWLARPEPWRSAQP